MYPASVDLIFANAARHFHSIYTLTISSYLLHLFHFCLIKAINIHAHNKYTSRRIIQIASPFHEEPMHRK